MDDIVKWLGEQLDEDRRVALSVREDDRVWEWSENAETVRSAGGSYVACGPYGGDISAEFAEHIARWDPARVLAEAEAKRAVLNLYRAHEESVALVLVAGLSPAHADERRNAVRAALRALALPYRDRPGWRPEWAPES